jgi:oligopeptidase B
MTTKNIICLLVFILSINSVIGQEREFNPPIPKKIPSQYIVHNDTVIDNYYWMRDKHAPEVINHLYAENAYADNTMKQSSFLQKVLYEEFKSRHKETFTSRSVKRKNYIYYNKTEKGKEYAINCRKKDTTNAPEVIILDMNQIAKDMPYATVSGYNISPDQQWLYYGIDSKGNNVMTYYLKHIDNDSVYIKEKLENVLGLVWAEDNKTVYYTKPEDKTLRSYRVYRHVMGRDVSEDELVFEESDKTFAIDPVKSSSKKYIFINISKTKSDEVWYLPSDGSALKPTLFLKREPTVKYSLDHLSGNEFVINTNLNALNKRLCKTNINQPAVGFWKDIIPHNDKVLLGSVDFTKDFMLVTEKENAQNRIRLVNLKTNTSDTLKTGLDIYEISYSFPDYDYYTSDAIEYQFSNFAHPSKTIAYNLYSKEKKTLQEDTILGGYKPENYETKRIYATARDGAKVPITLVYKKGLVLNGKNPCLINSYGSYGSPHACNFGTGIISYLDRGFVFAVAHIRGSSDLGMHWYEDGKLLHKKNTFYDFIDCADYLVAQQYTNPSKLAINGGSAGGLLMGAVTNMRPDLFKCVVANVPFVDVINTMLDETIPLTTFEFLFALR